ncbi:MAG: Sporulation and cell division protein SsgA [uncultured Nocardioidaceae bacterium]|uniref:Sporulation and cell division protein SsgA n=1 Tax=uncultured Nocardioidaceae bacterium TaxID=253824 RepID=A0A6J4L807_9ACTN|nr:MAG: Sporulation and cell division protein SsgA [uncultured Nocardioidaceae bacterium]
MRRHLVMTPVLAGGNARPIPATLSYDPADPLAVTVVFHEATGEVCWTFGRDLLIDGLRRPVGEGDVHVAPARDGGGGIALTLVSPDCQVTLEASRTDLSAFLSATTARVPRGRERTTVDVEAAMTAWRVSDASP